MSDVANAQDMIQETFPISTYGNTKASIYAAYRRLKLTTETRAKTIWYGRAKRIDAAEMDALREEKARQDAAKQQHRLQETAAYLREIDADLYQPAISTIERVAMGIGSEN